MIEAHPLYWPEYRPRTSYQEISRFSTSLATARDGLFDELDRLNAKNIIVSTNIELRRDGLPYASRRPPHDVGVAVYFKYKKSDMCFACDKYNLVGDNIHAIRKTIEALRGIARWGTGDMMEQAFRGFEALPAPENMNNQPTKPWREILWLSAMKNITKEKVEFAYRKLVKLHHPDVPGGSSAAFTELQTAKEMALKEIGN